MITHFLSKCCLSQTGIQHLREQKEFENVLELVQPNLQKARKPAYEGQ